MPFTPSNSEAFAKHIEQCVREKRMTYLDAIMNFCEERHLEPEAIVPYLNDKIKTELAREAQSIHLLKKRNELPF